jgi:outer membrane protein assembly factor BamB
MQDVEMIDVETGAPAFDPEAADDDPAVESERARRRARRRRVVRRWWPAPVVALALAVGTQTVLDARERDRVAARQEVEGVLRTVDPALEPTRRVPEDIAAVVLSGVVAGDLRIGPGDDPWEGPRELIAVDAAGETVWRASLERGGSWEPGEPGLGAEYPLCLAEGDPVTSVRCLVLDRTAESATEVEDGAWIPGPPTTGRLMTFDAATGEPRGEQGVPPVTGWDAGEGLQVMASVTHDALVVTAWAEGGAPDAEPRWRTELPVEPEELTPEQLTYPPTVTVVRGHVLVQGDLGSWALAAADGTLEREGVDYLTLTRGGRLTSPGTPSEVLGADGRTLATLPGPPLALTVDDGTVPDVELLVVQDGGDRRLVGFDVEADDTLWTLPRPAWSDSAFVLLDGVLYGSDREAVWAVDVATGRETWRTPSPVSSDMGGALTDGRHLLVVAATTEVEDAGVSIDPATGNSTLGTPGTPASSRTVLAYSLGDGQLAWATRLPDDVQGVWAWQGDLLAFGAGDVLVLN